MQKNIDKYLDHRKKIIAFKYVEWIINWDQKTQAPPKSAEFRSEQVEVLSEMYFDLRKDEEFLNTIDYLLLNQDKIRDEDLVKDIKKINKELRVIRKVPMQIYIDNQVILAKSTKIWADALKLNDFNHFAPVLEQIVEYNKIIIKYLEDDNLKGYDVLLDMFEEGSSVEFYDEFFEELKKELVPFVMEVTKGKRPKFNRKLHTREYPITDQKIISKYLLEKTYFDLDRGAIRDTIHSFTSGINTNDIRVTSDYHEDNFVTSIVSVLHEVGHAIYDQNNDPKYNGTFLFGSPSYGLHEAQARLYENMIGKSYPFWMRHYKKLEEVYPKQLNGIEFLEFFKYINQPKRSRIRTEADELTYPLHIMVRYEIEKELFSDKLKVRDIPRRWRTLMANYVGVKPLNDAEGALQDIHWSVGSFGYFPAYALGSAYAAQIYNAMNKVVNVESVIENDHINIINYWLKENINKFGASLTTEEILVYATGEKFNPKYYIKYLKEKFSKLNEINHNK